MEHKFNELLNTKKWVKPKIQPRCSRSQALRFFYFQPGILNPAGDETPSTIIIDNEVINHDLNRKSEREEQPFNKD